MMLKSAIRVNDFVSVNAPHSMKNGKGSGVVISVTDTEIVVKEQFTDVEYTFALRDLNPTCAPFTNSNFSKFHSVTYYWR